MSDSVYRKMDNENNKNKSVKNRNRKFQHKKRKNKLVLVFDENARREFLTGFHKRKVQRKNKAKEELEKQLKFERKRIKAQAKEEYKKLLLAQKPIPELEELLAEEIDMGTHSVSVTELSVADLAKKNNWIGINEVQYKEREVDTELNSNQNESINSEEPEGMELRRKNKKKPDKAEAPFKSCKDIKKKIKQQATLSVKKSKVYKNKAQFEKIRNLKRQKRQEKLQRKFNKKDKRSKHKHKNSDNI